MRFSSGKQEGKPASCLIRLAALAECDIDELRASLLKLRIFQLLTMPEKRKKTAPGGI